MALRSQLSRLAEMLTTGTSFKDKSQCYRLNLCLWILLTVFDVAAWLTATLIFANIGLAQFIPLVPDSSRLFGFSVGAFEDTNIITTSYLFTDLQRSKLVMNSNPLLLGSAFLPALCLFALKCQLKDLLNTRINKQNGRTHTEAGILRMSAETRTNSEGSNLLDTGRQDPCRNKLLLPKAFIQQHDDISRPAISDYMPLIVAVLINGCVAIFSGMTGGHVIFIRKKYCGIPIGESFSILLGFGFATYYICDAMFVAPKLWYLAFHVDVALDRNIAPDAVSTNICEVCKAEIFPKQVAICFPIDNSSTCCGDEGSYAKYRSHMLCFCFWGGAKCPGCPEAHRCNSFDLADNLFTYAYYITMVVISWSINKLQKAFSYIT